MTIFGCIVTNKGIHTENRNVAEPKVSVILVSYNTCRMTLAAIDALYRSVRDLEFPFEIIMVDNAGTDGTVEAVAKEFPDVRIIPSDVNLGFGRGNNRGADIARGEILFLLNTDTEIRDGAVEALYNYVVSDSRMGGAGAYLENPDGTMQPAILRFPTVWRIFCVFFWLDRIPHQFFSGVIDLGADPDREQKIEVSHGAAMMVRRDLFERIGGFDPDFFMYFEECDLCRRMADEGYRIGYLPDARVMHYAGGSSRSRPWWYFRALRDSRTVYARKHMNPLQRGMVFCIVHSGYLMRILLFSVIGLVNSRVRMLGKNMLLSYVRRPQVDGTKRSGGV